MSTSYELPSSKQAPHASYELGNRLNKSANHDERLRPSDRDNDDLQVRGVQPVFKRNFRAPGSFAYTINSIVSAEYFLNSLEFLLLNGGRTLLTFGLPVNLPGMACLYWSLGEMMSMAPTSGGQYRFVAENAPKSIAKPLSYSVGWMGVLGWQSFLTAMCFATGTIIQGLIKLHSPDYAMPAWHGVLLTIAVVSVSYSVNVFLLRKLPYVELAVVIFRFCTLIFVFVVLGSLPKAETSAVVNELGQGGWEMASPVMSFLVGLPNCYLAVSGLDCLWHLSEEVVDASNKLPVVLWSAVAASWTFAYITTVLLANYMPDIGLLLGAETGYPFISVFEEGFQYLYAPAARSLTTLLVALLLLTSITATANEVTASSRQLFGFARDGGLPFGSVLTRTVVIDKTPVPIFAITAVSIIVGLLSCVYLASATALNAFNSLAGVALAASYIICIGVMLHARIMDIELPMAKRTKFTMTRMQGIVVNIFALLYITFNFVFMFFPLSPGAFDADYFNWAIVVFGLTLVLAAGFYIFARKNYRPNKELE